MSIERVMANIVENAKKSIPIYEEDYVKDGFLHCYKCNTPKEKMLTIVGVTKKVRMLCECEEKARDEAQHKERTQKLRERCIPDKTLHKYTFANDDGKNPELTQRAKFYVEKFDEFYKEGKGLLLFGTVGYGKTYMTVCIANALIDKGRSCFLTDFSRIAREWESLYGKKEDYLERLNAHDVLIIDDLGVERDSKFVQEMVFSVIDYRLRARKPMIITTNLTPKEFLNPTDTHQHRIYSRLFEVSLIHECKGDDRRRAELVKANKEANRQMDIWSKQQ